MNDRSSLPPLSTGELVSQLSEQASRLIRDEIQLAQIEMSTKAKKAGLGAGLLGASGVIALYGLGAGIATAIIALALIMPAWLAGLIVTVLLLTIAGVGALIGKRKVSETTPVPERTVEAAKETVDTLKKGARDGRHK
ncbi:phage holin family protein [Brevibacterium sp. JSBI002]|uniref:phage holin family protein n=1 Tax=Brevibacterium sp. JSBI002 TaxID=2886045 RepID=UPI00223108ED|nr:phage holin family protein [Brevibacterium sp. JSBI002]UZD62660.1 phage holin family protein [Brevibacterium sp. JSBI002]